MNRTRGNGSGSIFKRKGRKPWYISWLAADGTRDTKCTKTTDKAVAQRILAGKLAEVALRRSGIIDQRQEAVANQSKADIELHLVGFEAKMNADRCCEKHVRTTMQMVRKIVNVAGFTSAADITYDAVSLHVHALANRGRKVSARTVQARIVAMKSFVHWLMATGKVAMNPLAQLKRGGGKDRSMKRRMLLPSEWPWLQRGAESVGESWGMSASERIALYATAIQTGFRSGELRELICADLFISAKPYIRGLADDAKNGQDCRQHIQAELADQLRYLVSDKTAKAILFNLPSEYNMADMLRDDLAAARELWLADGNRHDGDFLRATNHQGEAMDFHALRHTCGAWLAIAGVHPKTIQAVMRHSTITLTMDTYGHLLPDAHADAVAAMPMKMAATAATGAAIAVRQTAMNGEQRREDGVLAEMADDAGALKNPDILAESAEISGSDANASCRARTYDPLIKSQQAKGEIIRIFKGPDNDGSSTDSNRKKAS